MTNVLVDDAYLSDIADTIRSKLGVADTYLPSEMADAIDDIGGGVTPTGTKQISITANGTTTEDVTNYASAEITVNVSGGSSYPYTLGGFFPQSSHNTEIIGGNHVKITVNATGSYVTQGLRNLTNFNCPTWLTINAGDTYEIKLYNVVNSGNLTWNFNAKRANTTTSLSYGIGNGTHLTGETVTGTQGTTENIGCFFVYLERSATATLEFDVSVKINGTRIL